MANEKVFQSRIQLKHDIEENWSKATNFIPKVGEIIIYDIDENNSIARFKIGDGITNINSLPFVSHHEVISYLPQELTEEQQMQARANLGVYSTTLPIIEEGTIEIVNKQGHHFLSLEESTNIKLTLSATVGYNSQFKIDLIGYSDYNSNHMYLRMEASDDFRYNLIYEGDFWDFSNSGYDLPDGTYNFSLMKIQTLLVPEEYIPDTIARASDIPQNVVQYSEQTLSEEEQMQARANLGLYNSTKTFLSSAEVVLTDGSGNARLNNLTSGDICVLITSPNDPPEATGLELYGVANYIGNPIYDYSFVCRDKNKRMTIEYTFGEWNYHGVDEVYNGTHTISVYSLETKQVEEEYIPDTIARVADVEASLATKLTIPETASVGQLIKISAVDESGKVIATEGQNVAYEDEALDLLYEMKIIEPIAAEDGKILTLESGEILLL